MRTAIILSVSVFCLSFLLGRQAVTAQAFDVVSIKPVPADSGAGSFGIVGLTVSNQVRGRGVTAFALIRAAWPELAHNNQFVGASGWVIEQRFDFDAQISGDVARSSGGGLPPAVAQMLRRALEDRFQLRAHEETRELPVSLLTPVRSDRRLTGIRQSEQQCMTPDAKGNSKCFNNRTVRSISLGGMPIEFLIDVLAARTGRPIVNDTGLTGAVDLDLKWEVDFADPVGSDASMIAALRDQLGLKLENARRSLPVLVIDSIQRPSPN